jgi:hypothetical protein
VLAGAGLRDDAALAHVARDQHLTHRIVDLVRAGVIEILALEQDLCAANLLRQPLGVIDRARTADVVFQIVVEFGDEGRIAAQAQIGLGQLRQRGHQRLGDIGAAVRTEATVLVRVSLEIDLAAAKRFYTFIICSHYKTSSAERTAAMKRRILSISLTPSADSVPLETSTAYGRTERIASPMFPGVKPPANRIGLPVSCGMADQSNRCPAPPGSP